jgi:hypothetical protein
MVSVASPAIMHYEGIDVSWAASYVLSQRFVIVLGCFG